MDRDGAVLVWKLVCTPQEQGLGTTLEVSFQGGSWKGLAMGGWCLGGCEWLEGLGLGALRVGGFDRGSSIERDRDVVQPYFSTLQCCAPLRVARARKALAPAAYS